jgi:pyruvate,water dikinase
MSLWGDAVEVASHAATRSEVVVAATVIILAAIVTVLVVYFEKGQRLTRESAPREIVWFDEPNLTADIVGGKGASLAECARAGFPVPAGFCITASAYRSFLSTTGLDQLDSKALDSKDIISAPMPNELRALIADAYASLGHCMVAVRSSATAEDSAEASYAGQLETYLGVEGSDEVVEAVQHCWASLHASRVQSYTKSMQGAQSTVNSASCCVVVQHLVDADAAGVLFTANPLTKSRDESVITANHGLGESVVADLVTPDTYVLRKSGRQADSGASVGYDLVREDISKKVCRVKLQKGKGATRKLGDEDEDFCPGTTVTVQVPLAEQAKPSINTRIAKELAELGAKVEAHYSGAAMDIEWALKDGQLFLLQARPITTLDTVAGGPASVEEFNSPNKDLDWLTTCNSGEMFPGAGTPLTIDTFGTAVDKAMQAMQVDFGVKVR